MKIASLMDYNGNCKPAIISLCKPIIISLLIIIYKLLDYKLETYKLYIYWLSPKELQVYCWTSFEYLENLICWVIHPSSI